MKAAVVAIVAVLGLGLVPATSVTAESAPATKGIGANITPVANFPHRTRANGPMGTDVEFATINGRDYAFAGTIGGGLKIFDITDPRHTVKVRNYACTLGQGDVQIFHQGAKTMVAFTADDGYTISYSSSCYQQAGVEAPERYGTFLIDVSNPAEPNAVGFVPVSRGSHNSTIHPSGKFLYNSNSDLENPDGVIEVFDISKPARPLQTAILPLVTGLSSHDITFSADGSRAYVAALTHTLILDTRAPGQPSVIGRIIDPTVNIHHQADPVTITEEGIGERTFLVVTDELAGAAGNVVCPGGGLHVYDITGPLEALPVKVGFFAIPDTHLAVEGSITCTSHVLRMYPKQKIMTIAWYAAGVHVIDISQLIGVSVGVDPALGSVGRGMREVGWFRFPDSDTWSVKTNRIEPDGSMYLYANDIVRGFDVYRYTPAKDQAALPAPGTWLTPTQLLRRSPNASLRPSCLLAA